MNIFLLLASALVTLIALSAVVFSYIKLSSSLDLASKRIRSEANNAYVQTEALLFLYSELKPQCGFPQTRGWAASPDFLRTLVENVAQERPKNIVECSSGVSTIVLALALKKLGSGKVYSLEHDGLYAAKTRKLIKRHGLDEWATVIDAPLEVKTLPGWRGKWYSMENLPDNFDYDMLVIDGPPYTTDVNARYPAVPTFISQMTPNALIILDDANRPDEREAIARWLDEVPALEELEYFSAEKGISVIRVNDPKSANRQ